MVKRYFRVSLLKTFSYVLQGGPCSHDYTRIRTSDHLWTDPSASELMQRKLIYSAGVQNDHIHHDQHSHPHHTDSPEGTRLGHKTRRQRLSFDSGIGTVNSPASSMSQNSCSNGFALHTTPDLITPASLLYQLSSPTSNKARRGPAAMTVSIDSAQYMFTFMSMRYDRLTVIAHN